MENLEVKAQELQELKRMREELDAEIEAVQDAIKTIMGTTEEMTVGAFRITWKSITTNRIDTAAMKKAMPEVVAQYTKTSTVRRFTVM